MKQFKNRNELMDWNEKFLENYHNSLGLDPVEALLHFPSDEEYFSARRADGYDVENPVSNPDVNRVEYRVSFVNGDVIAQFVTPDFISREDAMRIAGIEIWGFVEGIMILCGKIDRDADGNLLKD